MRMGDKRYNKFVSGYICKNTDNKLQILIASCKDPTSMRCVLALMA